VSKPSLSRRAIAFGALGFGVLAIFAVNAARQRESTEEHARIWVGGQWDVARNCLVGTPIGRGEDEAAIEARLDRMLIAALVATEATEATEAAAEPLWPARCAPILRTLEVDRSILRRDPGDALAQLTVLTPRVLPQGEGDSIAAARARAHELARSIHTLDRAMPFGEEYDRPEPAQDAVPIDALFASFACEPPPQTGCPAEPPAVAACEGDARVEGVPHADGYRITVCRERCERPASIEGQDLRLALLGDRALAVVRGARSELTFARVWHDGRWSEPYPIARGAVSSSPRGFRIDTCDGVIESIDGRRWRQSRSR
jgi:hypothetical protein